MFGLVHLGGVLGKHAGPGIYSVFGRKKSSHAVKDGLPTVLPSIWRFALSLSARPDLADDLTQATCLRAIEKAHQFKVGTRLDAWCLTICRSIWLNEVRASALRQAGTLDGAANDLVDLHSDTEANIFANEVFTRVMALPEALRATVVLVYVEGHSYREAAEILAVPIGTIMSRLASARKTMTEWANMPEVKPQSAPDQRQPTLRGRHDAD